MSEQHEYRVTLRHGREGTHVQTLPATSRDQAIRLATFDAVEMSGGEPAGWTVESCQRLAIFGRAA